MAGNHPVWPRLSAGFAGTCWSLSRHFTISAGPTQQSHLLSVPFPGVATSSEGPGRSSLPTFPGHRFHFFNISHICLAPPILTPQIHSDPHPAFLGYCLFPDCLPASSFVPLQLILHKPQSEHSKIQCDDIIVTLQPFHIFDHWAPGLFSEKCTHLCSPVHLAMVSHAVPFILLCHCLFAFLPFSSTEGLEGRGRSSCLAQCWCPTASSRGVAGQVRGSRSKSICGGSRPSPRGRGST